VPGAVSSISFYGKTIWIWKHFWNLLELSRPADESARSVWLQVAKGAHPFTTAGIFNPIQVFHTFSLLYHVSTCLKKSTPAPQGAGRISRPTQDNAVPKAACSPPKPKPKDSCIQSLFCNSDVILCDIVGKQKNLIFFLLSMSIALHFYAVIYLSMIIYWLYLFILFIDLLFNGCAMETFNKLVSGLMCVYLRVFVFCSVVCVMLSDGHWLSFYYFITFYFSFCLQTLLTSFCCYIHLSVRVSWLHLSKASFPTQEKTANLELTTTTTALYSCLEFTRKTPFHLGQAQTPTSSLSITVRCVTAKSRSSAFRTCRV